MATTKFDIPNDFPLRLKAYRERASISQARLAELLGIATNYVGMLETGSRKPSGRLAQHFCHLEGLASEPSKAAALAEAEHTYGLQAIPLDAPGKAIDPAAEIREILTFCESLRQLARTGSILISCLLPARKPLRPGCIRTKNNYAKLRKKSCALTHSCVCWRSNGNPARAHHPPP